MPTILLRNADLLVTMDENRRIIPDGGLFIQDGVIQQAGPTAELPNQADQVVDARGMVVLPGLVNTHHHLYQTLTRALPAVQDAELFDWLTRLYRVWGELTAEAVYVSAKVGLAELLLSGCTTASDLFYVFPQGSDVSIDAEIAAAREMGIRFHAGRGSMSRGQKEGGLPPDEVVQDEETILDDCRRLIRTYHDPRPYAMLRIDLSPCSPFSVSRRAMEEIRDLGRREGVRLHTHLAETRDEERYCLEVYGRRPLALMEELGWLGPDVWFAHVVHVNPEEIRRLAETGSGVAHCPTSNMRLGSGIAPVVPMLEAGVTVGLAVDGSASNDSSHMLAEARQALLLQRVRYGAAALSAGQVLEMATLGGARLLGREDIGALAPGRAADLIGVRRERLEYAGAQHDPLAALVLCHPATVDLAMVQGQIRVWKGEIPGLDLPALLARHNALAEEMVSRAEARYGQRLRERLWRPALRPLPRAERGGKR
jgi:cytosine/adenosine deaminase-related metal-dependent hydrolase